MISVRREVWSAILESQEFDAAKVDPPRQ